MAKLPDGRALPGKLFIVEGIDGSGKSTQLDMLRKWLISHGYCVAFSEWNSSPVVRDITRRGKKKQLLSPTSFSLIHAGDFFDRMERQMLPALKAGSIVLADRYIYTAFARDVARGVHPQWVRNVYSSAIQPTTAFYFHVSLDESLERIMSGRPKLKYYEAGMDMGLSDDPFESYKIFQGRVLDEYEKMVDEFNFEVIDATSELLVQQEILREVVEPHLGEALCAEPSAWREVLTTESLQGRYLEKIVSRGRANMTEVRFYGYGPPGFKKKRLPGKLVVFEGTDGVGRSTQIALLREWLESEGYAVAATGLKRGKLAGKAIKYAMQGHTLGDTTMNLSYATDFADRLERDIVPALKASFVVLIDRYIFSLIARAQVRGADPAWIRNVLGFAMVPDVIFYLQADISNLVPRVLNARGFDYWESGMDFLKGRDYYDSYVEYQTRLIAQFEAMVEEFNFVRIDANRSILDVFQSLQANIKDQIKGMKPPKRRKLKKAHAAAEQDKDKAKDEKASKKEKKKVSEKKDGKGKDKNEAILTLQKKKGGDVLQAKKDNDARKGLEKAESENTKKETTT